MSELDDLRREAKRLQANAARKVLRLEDQGIRILNTQLDPRVDTKNIGKYNTRQLKALNNRLSSFNSRSTKFVKGYQGSAISQMAWQRYKWEEAAYNRKVASRDRMAADIYLPNSGVTVGERQADFLPSGRRRIRTGEYKPLAQMKRETPGGIMGAEGMKKLTRNIRKKSGKKYLLDSISKQKYNALELVSRLGSEKLSSALKSLDSDQFDLLWNETRFADDAAAKYATTEANKSGKNISTSDDTEDLIEMVEWARGQNIRRVR